MKRGVLYAGGGLFFAAIYALASTKTPSQAKSTHTKLLPKMRLLKAFELGQTVPIRWVQIEWSSVFNGQKIFVNVGAHALGVDNRGAYTRLPVSFNEAIALARANNWTLPTAELENAIWNAARVKLAPTPQLVTSPSAVDAFNDAVNSQITRANAWNELAATEGKAWILSARNLLHPNRVANYGWHQLNGKPIQSLGPADKVPVHDRNHADYSQTFRPIQRMARRADTGEQIDLLDEFVRRGLPRAAVAELRKNAPVT